jgi:predicted PurR-regulated permease PerM
VPRVISFLVLLTTALLVGVVFFRVMAQFIVPLFLACVLLVIFQPLHAWTLRRIPGRPRVAALVTTVLILLVVLLPLVWLGWNAYSELAGMLAATPAAPAAVPEGTTEDTHETLALAVRLKTLATARLEDFKRFFGIELKADMVDKLTNEIASRGAVLVVRIVKSTIAVVVGLAIMVLALYYFLADGPSMIRAGMELSPLDSQYEKELLERFGQVSRAVVVATLLSAVVQGSLAGIGYYFALPSGAPIFLLTAATMVAALIPFVGAAFVWVIVCVWVYIYGGGDGVAHGGNWGPALALAIYSTIVVSGIDNVIKPLVLRGQSNLHPLLALLSILGGVQVLGPVGILIGPMVVSFLQALLSMMQRELDSFSGASPSLDVLAGAPDFAPAGGPTAVIAADPSPAGDSAASSQVSPKTKSKLRPARRRHKDR